MEKELDNKSSNSSLISDSKSSIKTFTIHEETFLGNPIDQITPYSFGKVKVLMYIGEKPFLTIGPDWYLSIILLAFNTAIQICVNFFLYKNLSIIFSIIGNSVFAIWIISYLITIFKNPGIPSRQNYLDVTTKKSFE